MNNMTNTSDIVLSCKNLSKIYHDGARVTEVLKGVSFDIYKKQLVAVVGKSGSGKSTLLHLLGGLDTPSNGEVIINGQNIRHLPEDELAKLRNRCLGFIYQFHHLMLDFTALENVMIPLLIAGDNKKTASDKAEDLLTKVGLSKRISHKPSALSGGERQRVAIARALINKPSLILADEPTGNLDNKTSEEIFALIQQLNYEQSTSFLLVTHDLNLANQLQRQIVIADGQIVSDTTT